MTCSCCTYLILGHYNDDVLLAGVIGGLIFEVILALLFFRLRKKSGGGQGYKTSTTVRKEQCEAGISNSLCITAKLYWRRGYCIFLTLSRLAGSKSMAIRATSCTLLKTMPLSRHCQGVTLRCKYSCTAILLLRLCTALYRHHSRQY